MEACRNPVPPFSIRSATSATDWNRWKRDLELYFAAENVTSNNIKKAKLLFYGGREIIDLFDSLTVPEALLQGENVYSQAVRLLTEQINPTHNDLYERCMLRRLKQSSDESFSQFVTRVRQQAKKCNLVAETLTVDNYILEQLVDGCFSDEIRKELMKKGLQELAEAEKQANVIEAINAQCKAFQLPVASTVPDTSESVKRAFVSKNRGYKSSTSSANEAGSSEQKVLKCYRCGSEKHLANDESCPAKKVTCSKCNKVGHFAKFCRSPNSAADSVSSKTAISAKADKAVVKVVCTSDDDGDPIFCVPTSDSTHSRSRAEEIVDCEVGGVPIQMFIDSGCKWSIMGLKSWRKLESKGVRHYGFNYSPDIRTYDASFSVQYEVLFSVSCEIHCDGSSIVTNIIVVREHFAVILGSPDAKALHLLRVGLNAVPKDVTAELSGGSVKAITASSFTLSKLQNYQLELPINQVVTPVIQPIRRVPYALRAAIRKELSDLQSLDVIEPVTGPSRWVSPMVPVPKGENSVPICVDMRLANIAILDEKHLLPTIEDLLPLLKDAVLFSKIDLKMAYHQIELHSDSREITTFGTPFGLFRYKRLMLGLKCAPEQFQKIMENLLRSCDGVFIYLDDILVFGRSQQEHDRNLTALLHRIQELGLTLSPEKCQYRKSEIVFLGHSLGAGSIKPTLNKVKATVT